MLSSQKDEIQVQNCVFFLLCSFLTLLLPHDYHNCYHQAEIDAEMASVLSKVRADIECDASKDRKNRTKELEAIREDVEGA